MLIGCYNALTIEQQLDELFNHGVQVALARQRRATFRLFALYEFYVELATPNFSETTYLTAFNHPQHLDKYLEQIDLEELLFAQ